MLNSFILALKSIWEFPTNLIGYLVTLAFKGERLYFDRDPDAVVIVTDKIPGWAACWGRFILSSRESFAGTIKYGTTIISFSESLRHEYGHRKQAAILGPFYFLIVGLPSVIHAGIWLAFGKRWNYWKFPTERDADRRGRQK